MELSATSTTVTGPVGERLQAGTEDAPVLHHPAPLRYPDFLTYLLTFSKMTSKRLTAVVTTF